MKDNLLAFFGHHKGATTWINDITIQICHEMELRHASVHNPEMFNYDLREFVETNEADFLAYTNADYEYVRRLRNFKGFHVVRDPRDIVVSAYFSHLYSHPADGWPALVEHKSKLRSLTKDQGLIEEMRFRRDQFQRMYEWEFSLPNVMQVKMEDMVKEPYQKFLEILRFLGILDEAHYGIRRRLKHLLTFSARYLIGGSLVNPFRLNKLPAERLLGIIYENDFTRKTGGRKPGKENIRSHYRKGVPGDWRNHFTEEHSAFFKSNYNDVLVKLGYERDHNW